MEQTRTAPRVRKSIAIAVALAAALTIGSPAGDAIAGPRTRAASELLSLHNQIRKADHNRRLKLDRRLTRDATRHSRAMARRGGLYHSSNLGKSLRNRRWSLAGENVGMTAVGDIKSPWDGQILDTITMEEAVQALQDAFMASPAHRKNILRKRFHHAAAGFYESRGILYVTVIFYG